MNSTTLTPHQIDTIWRQQHRHAPQPGTWAQLTGDQEAGQCACGERITRRDLTLAGTRHVTAWSSKA